MEAKLLKQEEGVDLKDFENTSSDLRNQFILHLCYKNVRMEHHNLLDQCGARDYILVDIDGLIQHLISKENYIDWEEHGGQYLHLTYCLERFIQNMQDRSMKFDVVMFENAGRALCSVTEELQSRPDFTSFKRYNVTVNSQPMTSQYLLARTLIRNHLETKLGVRVFTFNHWQDNEWTDFLIQSRPAFVVAESNAFLFTYHCFLLNNVPVVCDIYFKSLSSFGFSTELYVDIPSQVMQILPAVLKSFDAIYYNPEKQSALKLNGTSVQEVSQLNSLFTLENNKIAYAIVACCNLLQNNSSLVNLHLSQLLLATLLLQTNIPLAYRSQHIDYKYPAVNSYLEQFYGELLSLISTTGSVPDLYDIIDGRLLHTLLNIQSEKLTEVGKPDQPLAIFSLDLPEQLQSAFTIGQEFIQSNGVPQLNSNTQFTDDQWQTLIHKESIQFDEKTEEDLNQLLPVHNPLIDDYVSDLRIPELPQSEAEEVLSNQYPSDTAIAHWHAKEDFEAKVSLRTLQRRKEAQDASLKRLHDYAESLGRLNLKRAIETEKSAGVEEKESEPESPTTPTATSGKKGKPAAKPKKEVKKPTSSKAETIILKNSIQKNSTELDSIVKQFKTLSDTPITSGNVRASMRALEDHVKNVNILLHAAFKIQAMVPEPTASGGGKKKGPVKPSAEAEAVTKLIKRIEDTLMQLFSFELKTAVALAEETTSDGDYYKVIESTNFIYDYLKRLKQSRKETFADIYALLAKSLYQVGFRGLAEKLVDKHPEAKVLLDFSDPTDDRDPNVLQLRFNTSFRSIDQFFEEEKVEYDMSHLDSKSQKVKEKMIDLGFRPDPWQLELIDHVDRNKSVLCAAPTSSGKTFIAFYVIEKVLREDDDSVVVFCLPTKALVNQVFAEIYSKYTKKYTHAESRQMLGMFTSTDRINVTTAQVLVTIPQCLEIMMFSHTKENIEWRERLKYVILDEIHCMNSDSGDLWEHILLMIKCPFLALSATIGNPVEFTDWLRTNKQNVELVQYSDRPQPLEFEVFTPPIGNEDSQLTPIHPCAVLNPFKIVDVEIDRLATLSASECISFYSTAVDVCSTAGIDNIFEECSPANLTKGFGLVSRATLLEYRKLVTNTIKRVAKSRKYDSIVLEIFARLRQGIDVAYNVINNKYSKKEFESQYFLKKHFTDLIMRLKAQQQLPTLCFYFSRFFIDKLMETLLDFVKANRINLWETDRDRTQALLQINSVADDLLLYVDEVYVEALRYGISVHYNAIHENYQKAVERLFRQRALPVIIATTTLALGIHMPARSVVIVGKSKYLDTTLFYQCAGRAGRRGFDTLGRVCIYGIDQAAVNRYMTSAPPSIMGSMGLKPSFLLRMMISYFETLKTYSDKEKLLKTDYLRVLKQPLFVLGKILPQSQWQVKHYFRYSVEFLARNGFVNDKGAPLDFAGFISRLHYHEPFNFMLVLFAQYDRLHDLLKDEEVAYEKRLERLLGVLAYFFGRIKVFQHDVMCKTLPQPEGSILEAHGDYMKHVKQIYSNYVRHYCMSYPAENEDTELPLSHIKYKYVPSEITVVLQQEEVKEEKKKKEISDEDLMWNEDDDSDLQWNEDAEVEEKNEETVEQSEQEQTAVVEEDEGEIVNILRSQRRRNHATSSFAALSGNSDNFHNIEQLLQTVKHTMVIDSSVIPSSDITSQMLNSYAVDFFSHGNLSRLCRENSFHSANAAKTLLAEVNNDLRTLRNALDTMNIPESDILLKAIRDLSYEFNKRFLGYEYRRRMNRLRNVKVEESDIEKYGKKATREDKQYGDKRENMDLVPKRAKEDKVQKRSKHFDS
jgi:hypothetical protein